MRAILLLDMPSSCADCSLFYEYMENTENLEQGCCSALNRDIDEPFQKERDCPLIDRQDYNRALANAVLKAWSEGIEKKIGVKIK